MLKMGRCPCGGVLKSSDTIAIMDIDCADCGVEYLYTDNRFLKWPTERDTSLDDLLEVSQDHTQGLVWGKLFPPREIHRPQGYRRRRRTKPHSSCAKK